MCSFYRSTFEFFSCCSILDKNKQTKNKKTAVTINLCGQNISLLFISSTEHLIVYCFKCGVTRCIIMIFDMFIDDKNKCYCVAIRVPYLDWVVLDAVVAAVVSLLRFTFTWFVGLVFLSSSAFSFLSFLSYYSYCTYSNFCSDMIYRMSEHFHSLLIDTSFIL
jgi:hypothetical protein